MCRTEGASQLKEVNLNHCHFNWEAPSTRIVAFEIVVSDTVQSNLTSLDTH